MYDCLNHVNVNCMGAAYRSVWRSLLGIAICAVASFATAQTPAARPTEAWKTVQDAAATEGKVVVYAAIVPPVMNRLKEDFNKLHPNIQVEATRVFGAAGNTRLDMERQSNADGADVAVLTEVGWVEARAKERAIAAPRGPSSSAWPTAYMIQGAAAVMELEGMAIVYNTNLVKTPITGYRDLLRPELKGKVGTVALAASAIVAWYDWLEKTQGADFLPKLAAQSPGIYASSLPGVQSVAAGEYAAITFANTGSVVPLVKQGAPIKMVIPNPQFGLRYAGGVLGWSKRPNAAQVFVDYLMSPRGQAIWHGQGDSASPLPNIPGALDARTLVAFDDLAYPRDVVNTYTERWNALFKK